MRNRPIFPLQLEGMNEDWKAFLKDQFDDLYPKIQPFTPAVTGVTGGTASGALMRMGRLWLVSYTVTGASTASSAYIDLPFTSFSDVTFSVKLDTDDTALVAYIEKNTSRLHLPDWTSSTRVIVSGTAGE